MARNKRKKILVVFGTRPEAIKLAPVVMALKKNKAFHCQVCSTGQHKSMVRQIVKFFNIKIDFNLNVMKKGQDLSYLTKMIVPKIAQLLDRVKPDIVVVQGDTTTVFLVSLAAFYKKINVAHVEAGLRTHDKYYPFPEEINRRLVSPIADFHFCPTSAARNNLLEEGIDKKKIFITGNTSIDALKLSLSRLKKSYSLFDRIDFTKKIVLVTAHRRESFGRPLEEMFRSFVDITKSYENVEIVYPVHLNPNVQKCAKKILAGHKKIHLMPPVSYDQLIYLMNRSYLLLTDSGGIQEEGPSLKKPVLVMREETERPEGIKLGVSKLVGRNRTKIYAETLKLLRSPAAYKKMIKGKNPYGDGLASERIVKILKK